MAGQGTLVLGQKDIAKTMALGDYIEAVERAHSEYDVFAAAAVSRALR